MSSFYPGKLNGYQTPKLNRTTGVNSYRTPNLNRTIGVNGYRTPNINRTLGGGTNNYTTTPASNRTLPRCETYEVIVSDVVWTNLASHIQDTFSLNIDPKRLASLENENLINMLVKMVRGCGVVWSYPPEPTAALMNCDEREWQLNEWKCKLRRHLHEKLKKVMDARDDEESRMVWNNFRETRILHISLEMQSRGTNRDRQGAVRNKIANAVVRLLEYLCKIKEKQNDLEEDYRMHIQAIGIQQKKKTDRLGRNQKLRDIIAERVAKQLEQGQQLTELNRQMKERMAATAELELDIADLDREIPKLVHYFLAFDDRINNDNNNNND